MSLEDMLGSKIFTFGPKSGATGAACSEAAAGPDEAASAAARTATQSKRSTSVTFPTHGKLNLCQESQELLLGSPWAARTESNPWGSCSRARRSLVRVEEPAPVARP